MAGGSLNITDMSEEKERLFWETLSIIVSRTLLLSSTQTNEDCLSHCWRLRRSHLIVLWDYRPGVLSFVGFLETTCRMGCVHLHVYAVQWGQFACNLIWWSLIMGSRDVKIICFWKLIIGCKKLIFSDYRFLLNSVTIVIISKCEDSGFKPASRDSSVWRIFPTLIACLFPRLGY